MTPLQQAQAAQDRMLCTMLEALELHACEIDQIALRCDDDTAYDIRSDFWKDRETLHAKTTKLLAPYLTEIRTRKVAA